MTGRRYRWRVAIGSSLLLAGVGIWLLSPVLLLAAAGPITFVAYGALSAAPPAATSVDLTRTVTPARTYPGGTVSVELTVTNNHDSQLFDVRIADGVPAELAVVSGSPRAALSLEPGETVRFEYVLRARYGAFDFDAATVRTHSLSSSNTDTAELPAAGDTRVTATLHPEAYPLGEQTTGITGELATSHGGTGLEFHAIRSYQPEDPMNRINWRQYARERQLSTIEYRQEEAVEVMTVVDARASTQVARRETAPTGTELCVYIASEVIGGLLQSRNRVGTAVLGLDGRELAAPDAANNHFAWVTPGSGRNVRSRITAVLDAAAATTRPDTVDTPAVQSSPDRPTTGKDNGEKPPLSDAEDPFEIVQRLHARTQVILVTPLCDSYPVALARQLRSTGHSVTVYAPTVTSSATAGGRVTATQRTLRVTELRQMGVTVVDWDPTEPLEAALNRSATRTATSLVQS